MAKNDLWNYYGQINGLKVLNPMRDRFQKKKILNNNEISIVYLGRLDISKGVIDLVDAFNSYCLIFPETIIRLQIAGSGSQIQKVKFLVEKNKNVSFVGALPYSEIDDYLNKAHYTIIPSKFDNLPTVGLESLMNQTPILISNTTGLTNELMEGVECFKFDANVESMIRLFEKIEKQIDINKQQQMSINARKTFLKKFSVESYFFAMEKII